VPELTLEALATRVADLERKVAGLLPDPDPPGTTGDEQADDAESVARWLAAFDAIPPLQMTPAEEAAWRADRDARRAADATRIDRIADRLSGSNP
jgi:hypothetical protein